MYRPLGELCADALFKLLCGMFPDLLPLNTYPKSPKMQQAIWPHKVAAKAEKTSFSFETSCLPTLRIGCSGSRDIFAVPGMALSHYMAKVNKGKVPSLKDMAQFLKAGTVAQIESFQAADPAMNKFAHMTAGPQDAVMMPLGWIYAERIALQHDFFGYKVCMLQKCDLEQIECWNRHFVRQDAASEIVQQVIDHLTLLES